MNKVNNNTEYHWAGMRKLPLHEVCERLVFGNLEGCYMLYPDNSEALIEDGYSQVDILRHCEAGGEIGEELVAKSELSVEEVLELRNQLSHEFVRAYLGLPYGLSVDEMLRRATTHVQAVETAP